jgi:putative Holliday junction resolvase
MIVIAVDPGEKRLGIAISDPTATIANPLLVLEHVSRPIDAASIAQIALERDAQLIVIGQALDADNLPTPQARRAARLAGALREQTSLPVVLWDESGSTKTARQARIAMNSPRHKRSGHMDDLAATVILQTYLDAQASKER